MDEASVLIVENQPLWQRELVKEVLLACPDSPVCVPAAAVLTERGIVTRSAGTARGICLDLAVSYEDAEQRLAARPRWDLVILDIALTDANDDKQGKLLAKQLRGRSPYLFVSSSRVIDRDDMGELLVDDRALDYFDKELFHSGRFQSLVRKALAGDSGEPVPPPAALPPSADPRSIGIGWGADSYTLALANRSAFSLPAKFLHLFECFARKVASGAAGEDVRLLELNLVVAPRADDKTTKASEPLRKAISKLNECLERGFGSTSDGGRWIESSRTSGYALNVANVCWSITDPKKLKELRRVSQSVSHVLIDAFTMQNNTRDDSDD